MIVFSELLSCVEPYTFALKFARFLILLDTVFNLSRPVASIQDHENVPCVKSPIAAKLNI